ncbi:class II aldolase [Enterococcus gilvus]|uniref:class II aldolase n=1 Tax=Enterococcus gilvus TaxID=160453 RepID=UPI001C8C293F|nr:class II aldolase [Enterococcus gilvus]MBX8938586.1 class II aldolase [Enterococcus gilvus]
MPLVDGKLLVTFIQEQQVMGGAFNTTNLETTVGILDAIEETSIPSFIQIAPSNIGLAGYEGIVEIVKRKSSQMDTPVALHLDHGKKMEDFKAAVRAGFTSVMIDGAEFDFEENIRYTKEAVEFAKAFGVPVEAELGAIKGKEDDHVSEADCKTDPKQVKEFVERTGCDLLAVSVGNVHGMDEEPRIDFDLLSKIQKESPVPLVIHGGSGISSDELKKMKKYNVVKINVASELRQSYIQSVGHAYDNNHQEANLIAVLTDAKNSVQKKTIEKIKEINN